MAVIANPPEQVAQEQPKLIAQQSKNKPRYKLTPEKAREAAIRSHNARRLAKLVQPTKQPSTQEQSTEHAQPADAFTLVTLSRVRDQMSLLADMMKKEKDPARLDRLAAAFGKLAEVERQLAGRPLPGSLRPSNRPAAGGMIEQPQTSAPGPSSAPPVQSEAQE